LFTTHEVLIDQARKVLEKRRHLLWLIDGSGSGKTTR
jgi:hypothetical protein